MSFAIGKASPEKLNEQIRMKYGAKIMMGSLPADHHHRGLLS